jgi:hypothetical protein
MKSTYYADYGIINLLLQNTLYGYWLLMGYGTDSLASGMPQPFPYHWFQAIAEEQ